MICVQELGLTSQYCDDVEFRRYCAMINGLTFLPLTDIHAGMDVLRRTLPSAAKPLIECFDETYVRENWPCYRCEMGGIQFSNCAGIWVS